MNAEKTRALASAEPAASKTLFGCQSIDKTVDRSGFFKCLEVHQLFSSSKEQTATDLMERGLVEVGNVDRGHVALRLPLNDRSFPFP